MFSQQYCQNPSRVLSASTDAVNLFSHPGKLCSRSALIGTAVLPWTELLRKQFVVWSLVGVALGLDPRSGSGPCSPASHELWSRCAGLALVLSWSSPGLTSLIFLLDLRPASSLQTCPTVGGLWLTLAAATGPALFILFGWDHLVCSSVETGCCPKATLLPALPSPQLPTCPPSQSSPTIVSPW